jgi:F-type H+-transporting ATPase subunit alpha
LAGIRELERAFDQALERRAEGMGKEACSCFRGFVGHVGDAVATGYALPKAVHGELVVFASGVEDIVFSLVQDGVSCVLFSGDEACETGTVATVPVAEALLGSVVNPLVVVVDRKEHIESSVLYPVEAPALSEIDHSPVMRRTWRYEPSNHGLSSASSFGTLGVLQIRFQFLNSSRFCPIHAFRPFLRILVEFTTFCQFRSII